MKKLLFTALFVLFYFCVSMAEETYTAFYILPRGFPFSSGSFESPKDERVLLHFGDKVRIINEVSADGVTWFECSRGNRVFHLPEIYVIPNIHTTFYDDGGNIAIGYSSVNRVRPLPLDYIPNDLVTVPPEYRASRYDKRNLLLRRDALEAFIQLIEDAAQDGVKIRILSAFRDSKYQSYLYYNAIKKHGIYQNRVAKPGHSEHQLGTVCDLTTDEIRNELSLDFERTPAYRWLMEHSASYGISLSYPRYKEMVTGYIYEPWHFRFWGYRRWAHLNRSWNLFYTR